jgi:SAM-dependent methyltransferase
LTLSLAQLGYHVTGLDNAPQMLSIAREKAAASQQHIEFICQDMRQPYKDINLDAVVCFYGGLNFLNTAEALQQGFTTVLHALRPGGLLAFDLFSVDKMRILFSGVRAADYGDFYVVTKSTCDEDGQIRHSVTFFLRNGDNHYRREEELHQIRIHPLAQVQQLLTEVGFEVLAVEALYPQVNARLLQDVSLIIAQKPR